jgi:hypothetical protein
VEAGAGATAGVAVDAGAACDDEEDADAAGALFCGPGASGSASAADSTGCETMGREGRDGDGCVSRVCAGKDTEKKRARAMNVAEIKLGEEIDFT